MKKRRRPELLVPAGSIEPFIAAVENGADAVYVGGRMFNARMNAGNFDDETLQQALDYAHARGVKVFVTMNTLVYDEELSEALEYATFLYHAGVDALIVQDLGLGQMIHRSLPDFPLHLSTQATSCDGEAVQLAKKLGYERVVLSRELSMAEIRKVCQENILDIEMFVHGALCICYSGQCQMSRFYGGRSGNRGACAQPCRLPYTAVTDAGEKKQGHLLSPRDLCLIDELGTLIDAGVYSFKIEGRMKSPEYVAVVTRIYRKYIDEYMVKGDYTVSPEDRKALEQIFNRGGFTEGYFQGNPHEKLMSPVIPKNQGIRIGTVTSVKKGSTLVDVHCDIPPDMGDGIEIRREGRGGVGRKAVSSIVSYRKELGNDILRIGDFKEPVTPGDVVYRTSSKKQLDEARDTYRHMALTRKIGRRRPIDLTLTCYNEMLNLTVTTVLEEENLWTSQQKVKVMETAGPFESDDERATPKERYENALQKTGNTPFEVRRIRMKGDFTLRVRASEINALRRKCLAELEEKIRFRRTEAIGLGVADCVSSHSEEMTILSRNIQRIPLAQLCLEAEETGKSLEDIRTSKELNTIPAISNVTKGLEDEILRRHETEIRHLGKRVPILVGNLGWLNRLLPEEGMHIYGDYGLNVLNRETRELLRSLGVEAVYDSLEEDDLDSKREDGFPLMITEHDFEPGELRNEKRGIHIRIRKPKYSSQCRVESVDSDK